MFENLTRRLSRYGHPDSGGSTAPSQAVRSHVRVILNADIWTYIMCELRGDARTLSRCAATSQMVRACALPELYRSLHLDRRLASVREFIQDGGPELRHHIRRLHVSTESACDWVAAALKTHADDSAGCPGGITLPSLRELRFSWMAWTPQIPPLVAGLGSRLSSIVTLEIANTPVVAFGPLQRMAASFPHLHTLRLYAVSHSTGPLGWNMRKQAQEQPDTPLLKLREFFVVSSGPTVLHTSPRWVYTVEWRHVQALGVDAGRANPFFEALRSAGASLLHLGIFHLPSHNRTSDQWHVPECGHVVSRLETLTLGFAYCREAYPGINCLPSVSTAVGIVQSITSTTFRRLTIMLREPSIDWLIDVEWDPLVLAVENLHHRLGSAIRLQVHVWLVGLAGSCDKNGWASVSGMSGMSRFADLHMHSIVSPSRDDLRYGAIPEFPLATLSDHRKEFET